ncbi:MAG: hypothetical protein WC457_02215 [Patescibacteria group bacterium]
MTNRIAQIYEVESAIARSPNKTESGRYAVYVPGAVVIGSYDDKEEAQNVAATWTKNISDVVIVDRNDLPLGVHTLNRVAP